MLKPYTVLLDKEQHIRICDFGFGKVCNDQQLLTTYCGSPFYAAPEMVTATPYTGPKVDIWSCGVILYAMLSGKLPFQCENMPDLFKKISVGAYNVPHSIKPSPAALIARMLCVKPSDRASAQDILEHTWLSGTYTDTKSVSMPTALNRNVSAFPLPGTEDNEPMPETDKVGDSLPEPNMNHATVARPVQVAHKNQAVNDDNNSTNKEADMATNKNATTAKDPQNQDKPEARTRKLGLFTSKKIQVAPLKTNNNLAMTTTKKIKEVDAKLLDKLRSLFRVPKKRVTAA